MSLFTPVGVQFSDYRSQSRFLLIWRLILGMSVFFAILTILFSFGDNDGWVSYFMADILIVIVLLYLFFTKNYYYAYLIFVYLGSVIVHADLNLVLDTTHFGNFFWMIVLIMLAFFGLGVRSGLILIVLNFIATLFYVIFNLNDHYSQIEVLNGVDIMVISIEFFCSLFIIGYLILLFVNGQKYSENKLVIANSELAQNNKLINKKNQEKTVLVKEIHHRVKNNLQIITSLLKLQMNEISNTETKEHFSTAINRVMVMSIIHQKLYQGTDISQFSLEDYVRELAMELKSFFCENSAIEMKITSSINTIDLKTVVPLGLIINELLSNSFKHAFNSELEGQIIIRIEDKGSQFKMEYKDNGVWGGQSVDEQSFGLELIDILTEQLSGSKELLITKEGTHYSFSFEKEFR